MVDSWSMTTSLQLAQECLKHEPSEGEQQAEGAQPFDGLEMFAQTIESGKVLNINHLTNSLSHATVL
jgi:hypothetical protein